MDVKKKLKEMKLSLKIELARRDFWEFCKLTDPNFYKEDRKYLKDLCKTLQKFYESEDEDLLVINIGPRFGKSYTATMFSRWVFGKNKHEKIMIGTYNETLSTNFSKGVRDGIAEEKADANKIVYSDIFPETRIKQGDGAKNLWSLEGSYNNYLATSPGGTATGFGATLLIIDDLIKNAEEALNDSTLEAHWDWFNNTMLSRLERGAKVIIIMTRWSTKDLAGRVLEEFKDWNIKHINYKTIQDDGSMLCDDIMTMEEFKKKTANMRPEIVSANYQQEPIDIQGRLYTGFKTYEELPEDKNGSLFTRIGAYIDTADTGADYLCCIIYGEYNMEAYILDVYYTDEPMEITEEEVAKRLYEYNVNVAYIESNNGGRGFARQVKNILRNKYKHNRTVIKWFHQSKNKTARILSNSTWVMEHIYFPVGWENKWSEYYKAMITYTAKGKNKFDDAPDATTGVAEKIIGGTEWRALK